MANMIGRKGILTQGYALLPRRGDGTASVAQAVHDGDTLTVQADGNFGVRFLGVDTPEVSFRLPPALEPNADRFVTLNNPLWEEFLSDALASERYGKFRGADGKPGSTRAILGQGLIEDLRGRLGPGCAANHHVHSQRAHRKLEELVQRDVDERAQQGMPFRFFLAFAYEVMDYEGRFLCYLHRDDTPEERRERTSYNGWMLEAGMAAPYFIWPNLDPFRTRPTLVDAVPPPDELAKWIKRATHLVEARRFVRAAREGGCGLFEPVAEHGPLRLLPFELRYLAQRRAPQRYVLDLSKAGTDEARMLLSPREYYRVPHWEDRLFIDPHFVPLFEKKGYSVQT